MDHSNLAFALRAKREGVKGAYTLRAGIRAQLKKMSSRAQRHAARVEITKEVAIELAHLHEPAPAVSGLAFGLSHEEVRQYLHGRKHLDVHSARRLQ